MATMAILTECAFVMIILLVTAHAIGAGAGKLVADMAVLARNNAVQTHQRKVGEVVVEAIDFLPTVSDMTGCANLHFRIFVYIICGVARRTVARQIILQRTYVTSRTGERLVFASERKAGDPRVIKLGFFPLRRSMAALTLLAVAPQVNIVGGVAAVAVHRRIFFHHTIGMASAAGNLRVFMGQRKFRGVVIKNALIPTIH